MNYGLISTQTSDGHDTSVSVAGKWCRDFLEPLINDKESSFWSRTLVLITFDESETYPKSNRVFSLMLGDAVPEKLVGTTDKNWYNHYSELSTVEANWDLHTLGRFDVGANVFDFVGKKTGDHIRHYTDATGNDPKIFYNSSYAGPLNENFEAAPYPVPNVNIESPRSGRTVLPSIVEKWGGVNSSTYYSTSDETPDGQHPPPGYNVNDAQN
jgi:hypothetical protein